MAESILLQPVQEGGWRSGLVNLLRKENGIWWRTRRWWVQSLVWFLILNGIIVLILWIIPTIDPSDEPRPDEMYSLFFQLLPISILGAMILMQSSIVAEKQSGTAAWIMSNPVSRISFILAKLFANTFAILLIITGFQGLIAYTQLSLKAGALIPALPFISALGVNSLHLLFYIALSLLLGTLFKGRGAVIGISLGVFFVQDIAGQILALKWPWFPTILPSTLASYTTILATGGSLPSRNPVIVTSILIPLFILLAIWRFHKEEF